MTIRLLSLDAFEFSVGWKLLEDAAADVVALCALRVHPGPGADHVAFQVKCSDPKTLPLGDYIIPWPQTEIGKNRRNLEFSILN